MGRVNKRGNCKLFLFMTVQDKAGNRKNSL